MSEHERIVGKLNGRQFLYVHHHFERFNALTYRGGNRRFGGRGRPYSEPNRDQSRGKGKQADLAHLRSPIHQLNRNMRCPFDEDDYAGLSLRPM